MYNGPLHALAGVCSVRTVSTSLGAWGWAWGAPCRLSLGAHEHTLWAGDFSGAVKVFDVRQPSQPAARVAVTPLDAGVGSAPIAGVSLSADGKRAFAAAAAFWDDDDDGPDGCVQVRGSG